VIPEGVLEAVDYLLERFGFALDREVAFKAKSLVTAKVKARLEKVAERAVEKTLRAAAFAGLSATALYSVYSGLYSETVVSSAASAIALAEMGEAVQYVQKAAKALYEAARDVFERVKVTAQRLVELFVEAVTRVLAWID
jgi:nucleotide-binding universal stress UspA family protein